MDIKQLLTILQDEAGLYEQMLELCREETKVLVAGNVMRLDEIVQLQSRLIAQLGKAEMERAQCIGIIADELGMKADEVNISALIKRVSEPQALDLKRMQSRLSGMLAEFKKINELNSQLIKNSIDFIDYTLAVLLDICQGPAYDAEGKIKGAQHESAVLDQRV